MPINHRESPLILEVIRLYQYAQAHHSAQADDLNQSVIFKASGRDWWAALGMAFQKGVIEGVDLPRKGGLSEITRQKIEADPNSKDKCLYYNYIYNTCYQYITDNQTRYFGAANLHDINNGKVIAMALIAHMCEQAINAPPEKEEEYCARIQSFGIALLRNEGIQKSSSNDSATLSCASALLNILKAEDKSKSQDENQIIEFYNKVKATISSAGSVVDSVNNYAMPLLSEFEVDVSELQCGLKGDDIKAASVRGYLAKPLVREIFIKPLEVMKEEGGYLRLYKGSESENKYEYDLELEGSYLLSQFNPDQKNDLKRLLTLRDKFLVLKTEFNTLYELSQGAGPVNFNEFMKLADPYLKEIHQVQLELKESVTLFDAHCGEVYRNRQQRGISAHRRQWERCYFNRQLLVNLELSLGNLAQNIARTFTSIPFNFYSAFKKFGQEANNFIERGRALFGHSFGNAEIIQEKIEEAQRSELERQAEIILLKQREMLKQYDDLIHQARESRNDELVKILIQRKLMIENSFKSQPEQADDDSDWVLVDSSEIIKKQEASFFQMVGNYFAGPSPQALVELQEALESAQTELQVAKSALARESALRLTAEQELMRVKVEHGFKILISQAIRKGLQEDKSKLENAQDIMSSDVLDKATKVKLKPLLKKSDIGSSKTLLTLLTNVEGIILQAEQVREAYKSKEGKGKHDATFFFSHNDRGRKHADKVIADMSQKIKESVQRIIQAHIDNGKGLSAGDLKNLFDKINNVIALRVSQFVATEDYSSHKQYSFRNYLRHFHQQVVGDKNTLKVNLLAENNLTISQATIDAVGGKFDSADLAHFEENVRSRLSA